MQQNQNNYYAHINNLKNMFFALNSGQKRRVMQNYTLEFNCSKRTFYNKINAITKVRKAEINVLLNLLVN